MATKALKTLTMNGTKYDLPNTLAIGTNGKLQLKAKDVVVSEVEVASKPSVNLLVDGFYIKDWCQDHSRFTFPASPSFSFTDANGNALTYAQFMDKALADYAIIPWFKFDSSSDFEPYYMGEAKPIDATGSIEIYIPINAWTIPAVRPVGGGGDLRDFFSVIAIVNPNDVSGLPAIRPAVTYIRRNFTDTDPHYTSFAVGDTFEKMDAHDGFSPKYVEICYPEADGSPWDAYLKVLPMNMPYNGNIKLGVTVAREENSEVVMQNLTIQFVSHVYTITAIENIPGTVIVDAKLTSDMSLNQVGGSAGWRGMFFAGTTFNDIVALLEANKVVYIALKGSTNILTAYAPLSLTRRFATDMWSYQLNFVADGSVFTINDTPEIMRN